VEDGEKFEGKGGARLRVVGKSEIGRTGLERTPP